MKKDKLKVLIATATILMVSTGSTVPSIVYAAESNKQDIIIEESISLNEGVEKNVEGNMEKADNYNGEIIEEVNVTSDVELINAIENPYVKVINLKSDIIITSTEINQSYEVYGDKKINGNNFEISTSAKEGAYQSYVSMKVHNTLSLENVSLRYIGFSSYSGSLIGKNLTTYESSIVGNVTLDQVNMTNGALDGKVKISNGKLNKTMLNPSSGTLSLTNVEVDALSYGICAHSSEVYLENVKIKNSEWTALELQAGSSAVLNGEIIFENVGNEAAILLEKKWWRQH
ncbi:MAG: pectate lyase-like adhesive domain-containing protein [Clostridium sp.]|nr:pectate lyase-like adhesive domain-containing protein [Clostridium sp.]MDU7084344.1 pectate lyase-like adhesive domain-containing protein [Clostridium sp.]